MSNCKYWIWVVLGSVLSVAPSLAQTYEVSGKVLTPNGTPIGGAEVRLREQTSNHDFPALMDLVASGQRPEAAVSRRTSADGTFRLVVPAPGAWFLEIGAEGFATISHSLNPDSGSQTLEPIKIPKAHKLELKLVDEDENPVAGALVRISIGRDRSEPGSGSPISQAARSDARGVVTLWTARGSAQLDIAAPGFVPGANRNIAWDRLAGGDWSEIKLLRAPQQTIKVTFGGRPVANAPIFIDGGRIATARTDSEGRALVAVPSMATRENPMPMLVEAMVGGFAYHHHFGLQYRKQPTDLEPVAITAVKIAPKPVDGVVVNGEGKPVPGVFVRTLSPLSPHTITDAAGRYSLAVSDQFPNATHATSVQVSGPGIATARVPVGQHQRIEAIAPRTLRITTHDRNGVPVPGVEVLLVDERARQSRFLAAPRLRGLTNQDGVAAIGPLATDKAYGLEAYRPGYRLQRQLLAARNAQLPAVEEVTIELLPGSVQVGWVVDEDDQAVEGAVVLVREHLDGSGDVHWMTRNKEPLQVTTTDAEGRFELVDLEPQKVALDVTAVGFSRSTTAGVELPDVDSDLGTVVLAHGLALVGRVVDDQGMGVSETTVQLHFTNGIMGVGRNYRETIDSVTNEAGGFRFEDLAEGSYFVSIFNEQLVSDGAYVQLPSEEEVVVEVERTANVPVRVVDEQGEVLTGSRLDAADASQGVRTSHRGGTGNVYATYPGTTGLRATDPSVGTTEFSVVLSETGSVTRVDGADWDNSTVTVTVEQGFGVAGTLRDVDGNPVAAYVSSRVGRGHGMQTREGQYRLMGLAPGEHQLEARAQDFAVYQAAVTVEEGQTTVHDIVMEKGFSVSGTVLSEAGDPVPSAIINVSGPSELVTWGSNEGVTDQLGRFRFENVVQGELSLSATATGYAVSETQTVTVDGPLAGLELVLGTGARVYGRVTGFTDEQLVGMQIIGMSGQQLMAEVGFDGRFEFNNVAAGTQQFMVYRQGRVTPLIQSVNVPASGEVEVNFEAGTLRLTGQVLVNGQPKLGAKVALISEGSMPMGTVDTDASGRFVIENLEEGNHTLMVADGYTVLHQEQLTLFSDQDVLVEVDTVEAVGRVVDENGVGIAGAQVSLMPDQSADFQLIPLGGSGVSGADGVFNIAVSATVGGTFVARASLEGYSSATAVWSTEARQPLQLMLSQGAPLVVRWRGPAPQHASLALVDERTGAVVQEATGYQGQWRMDNARLGTWALVATTNLVTASTRVTVSAMPDGEVNTVELKLPPTGFLLFSSAEGQAVGQAGLLVVRLLRPNGEPLRWSQGASVLRDWTPMMLTGDPVEMEAGNWNLEVRRGETVVLAQQISVASGQTTEVVVP